MIQVEDLQNQKKLTLGLYQLMINHKKNLISQKTIKTVKKFLIK